MTLPETTQIRQNMCYQVPTLTKKNHFQPKNASPSLPTNYILSNLILEQPPNLPHTEPEQNPVRLHRDYLKQQFYTENQTEPSKFTNFCIGQ